MKKFWRSSQWRLKQIEGYLDLGKQGSLLPAAATPPTKKEGKFLAKEYDLKLLNDSALLSSCKILEEKLELNTELSNTFQSYVIAEKAAHFTDFLDNWSTSCEVFDINSESCRLTAHRNSWI